MILIPAFAVERTQEIVTSAMEQTRATRLVIAHLSCGESQKMISDRGSL